MAFAFYRNTSCCNVWLCNSKVNSTYNAIQDNSVVNSIFRMRSEIFVATDKQKYIALYHMTYKFLDDHKCLLLSLHINS